MVDELNPEEGLPEPESGGDNPSEVEEQDTIEEPAEQGAPVVQEDEELANYDLELRPLFELPDTSIAVRAVDDLMKDLINTN